MGNTLILGIDHGNSAIKTNHCNFNCSFKMQETEPSAMFAKDILEYNKNFYSLTNASPSYQIDKTTNENAWILTLFGIAKEWLTIVSEGKDNFDFKKDFDGINGKDIVLAVGLPPMHFEKQMKTFKNYFLDKSKNGVIFKYNNKPFNFYVKDVFVYPQDYAGVIICRQEMLSKYSTVYCIDIGSGTTDMVGLTNGVPDKETMISREYGMSKLRSMIIDDVINDYGITLDGRTVEDFLMGKELALAPSVADDIKKRISKTTEDFATNLINQLHSKVADFRVYPTIFCGGGAIALKPYLEKSGMFGITDYIDDIKANAIGYQVLAKMQLGVQ